MIHKEYNDKLLHKITNADFIEFTFLNVGKLSLFAAFYSLAIIHKRNTAFHMRYMIASALVFVEPALSRTVSMDLTPSLLVSFLFTDMLLIALISFDKRKQLNYKPYALALAGFILHQTIWYGVFHYLRVKQKWKACNSCICKSSSDGRTIGDKSLISFSYQGDRILPGKKCYLQQKIFQPSICNGLDVK